jgi:hypothetical protein
MLRIAGSIWCAVALSAVGCSADPVSVSAPVGINLKAKSADATLTVASADKAITTESGNPWGAFITDAQTQLGADPGRIELSTLELLLQTTSNNVTSLNEVFDGRVDVAFIMNDTNNEFPVAHATIDAGTDGRGPLSMAIDFDSGALQGEDWTKLMNGSFKVSIAGPPADGFTTKGAEADLQLSFTFAAFE